MIKLLLADDQELVREGFRAILQAEPDIDVVGVASEGAEAVELARTVRPDVVLMDIRMPGVDGIEATRRLARLVDPPRVLILTTFDLDEYVYEALRAGAGGFLLKAVPRDQLVGGIRIVARGEALLAPALTRRLIERYVRRPAPDDAAARALGELTAREEEVLRLVARGHSNAALAAELFLSEATVKTHIAHILTKLNLRDRVQLVVFAYETGFVEPGVS